MTILADNRFEPIIEPALLDRMAVLSNEIADLKQILADPERERERLQREADEQDQTLVANENARRRITSLRDERDVLARQVARLP